MKDDLHHNRHYGVSNPDHSVGDCRVVQCKHNRPAYGAGRDPVFEADLLEIGDRAASAFWWARHWLTIRGRDNNGYFDQPVA